jgi:hypothetical protein
LELLSSNADKLHRFAVFDFPTAYFKLAKALEHRARRFFPVRGLIGPRHRQPIKAGE